MKGKKDAKLFLQLTHDRGPASVLISKDEASGGLRLTVEAAFFNSPAPTKEQVIVLRSLYSSLVQIYSPFAVDVKRCLSGKTNALPMEL